MNELTFPHGIPLFGLTRIVDWEGATWEAQSFKVGRPLMFNDKVMDYYPVDVIRSSNELYGPLNEIPIPKVLTDSETSLVDWNVIDLMDVYTRGLGECRRGCVNTDKCNYAFSVLKYLDAEKIPDDDYNHIDSHIYTRGDNGPLMSQACYLITDDEHPIKLEESYRSCASGTKCKVWKANQKEDFNVVATHVWKKQPYHAKYCNSKLYCVFPYGLPKEKIETQPEGWKHGYFRNEPTTLTFEYNPEVTGYGDGLVGPINLYDYTINNATKSGAAWPNEHFLRDLLPTHWFWKSLRDGYNLLLKKCRKECDNDQNCHYVWAAAKWFKGSGGYRDWDRNPYDRDHQTDHDHLLDEDIQDMVFLDNVTIFKCYGLPKDHDKYWEELQLSTIQGVSQYMIKAPEGANIPPVDATDPVLLFSSTWEKNEE